MRKVRTIRLFRVPNNKRRLCILLRNARSIAIGNNTLTIRTFLVSSPQFPLPPACKASLRFLFLQAHRETKAHFADTGVPSQRKSSDSFRFRRAAFFQSLKSKVGLAAKAAALRINLNIQGCGVVRDGQTSPHRPRLVVSRSTYPPLFPSPHASNFVIGTAVINTHKKGLYKRVCR